MKKIGIFYGSSTGTCEDLANRIADKLGVSAQDVHSAGKLTEAMVKEYEVLVLGSSTWGDGDMQDDWYDGVKVLKAADLSGKLVALFGCGDSASFGDTFCDAIGTIYQDLQGTGCQFIGSVDAADYTYDDSTAVVDGRFVGLALDEMNEDSLTPGRIDAWIESLKKEGIE